MTQTSLKSKVLRRLPGLQKYYATIARLNAERIDLTHRLEAKRVETEQLEGALNAARAQALAVEAERAEVRQAGNKLAGALALAQAHEAERDALRVELEQVRSKLAGALALAHAHEAERNSLLAERDTQRVNRLSSQMTEHVDLLLRRMAELQSSIGAAEAHVSANVLGASTRQEEMMSRLARSLRGPSSGGEQGAEMYLDLLEASLTGVLSEDGSQSPWVPDTYNPALRAIGRDWPQQALTMIGTARMRNLRMLTARAVAEGVAGDFIETGVWRGGACIYAKGIFRAMGADERRVFVADSFRGLPEPDAAANPADAGDVHHTYAALAIPRSSVEASFRRYGLLDENVVFLEGWFKDTLPAAPIERLAVLRLDGDMYESTMDALNALYHKVSPGGFVIVDDYILKPCAEAITDFRRKHAITAPMNPVDDAAVWWQVPV